jgi:D-alanyl-D-alanine carboxypeptidase
MDRPRVQTAALLLTAAALLLCTAGCTAGETDTRDQTEAEPAVHPAFDLSQQELLATAENLPQEMRREIERRPQYFLELVRRALELPPPYLRLVDKEHPLPEEYTPDDLVPLTRYPLTLNRSDLRLSRACLPDLLAMAEAARADGVELVLSSAFRSYEYQKGLYERYVSQHGREEADRFSARPGTSQHQLGLTIDFGSITKEIINTDQGQWLADHAWEYGFSLSYPEGKEELTGYMYEPWHFRYISRTGTRLEREFFGGMQQHLTEYLHAYRSYFRNHLSSGE